MHTVIFLPILLVLKFTLFLLACVMSLSLLFFCVFPESLNWKSHAILYATNLLHFFPTYIVCLRHFLGASAWESTIDFLVVWTICVSFSFVHFKNVTENFITMFIPLMRFLLPSLLSRSFLVHLSFLIFSFYLSVRLCFVFMVPTFNILMYL